ncbi:MAG: protein kinase domain-containing protein, partial [Planctomycetota bacterium]
MDNPPDKPAPKDQDASSPPERAFEGADTMAPGEEREGEFPATRAPQDVSRSSIIEYCRTKLGITPRVVDTEGEDPSERLSGPGAEDRYLEGSELARGGMGAILETFDRDLRRPVAMKVILEGGDREQIERFIEEAQVTGQLEHPNIVPVHEIGLNDRGKIYFTMKLVRGESLQSIVEKISERDSRSLSDYPRARLLQVFLKVCDAVAFAHSKGIIHRDLKPE